MRFSDTAGHGHSTGQTPKGDMMSYLDVRFFGQEIAKRYERKQLTCEVHGGLTTHDTLALIMTIFSRADLEEIAKMAMEHSFIILDWSAHTPMYGGMTLIVTLHLSEVNENGQSA